MSTVTGWELDVDQGCVAKHVHQHNSTKITEHAEQNLDTTLRKFLHRI